MPHKFQQFNLSQRRNRKPLLLRSRQNLLQRHHPPSPSMHSLMYNAKGSFAHFLFETEIVEFDTAGPFLAGQGVATASSTRNRRPKCAYQLVYGTHEGI